MQKTVMLLLFLTVGLFYSCQEKASQTVDTTDAEKEARQAIFAFGATPDSLLSPEQKMLMKNICMVIYEHAIVKDKRLELTIGKEEFKTRGIPEIHYDLLKKDMEGINHYLDTARFPAFTADTILYSLRLSIDERFSSNRLKQLE